MPDGEEQTQYSDAQKKQPGGMQASRNEVAANIWELALALHRGLLCAEWASAGSQRDGPGRREIVWHDWFLPLSISELFNSKITFKTQGKRLIFSFTKLQRFHPFNAIDLIFLILSAH